MLLLFISSKYLVTSSMSKRTQYILQFTNSQLTLKNTLINGQCFNWKQTQQNKYEGVLFQQYIKISRIDPKSISVVTFPSKTENMKDKLQNYFNKNVQLQKLYQQWRNNDKHFKLISKNLEGVRILKQQPWECIISFICSSNNNISRITKLLNSLRQNFGKRIYLQNPKEPSRFYTFPTIQDLNQLKAEDLKQLGFGYRADFIVDSVNYIKNSGGMKWINQVQGLNYLQKKKKLMQLKGVGRKVADCICLFSLNCHSSVPVDTHIFKIARQLGYINQKEHSKKALGQNLYNKIRQCYVQKFGQYAGWAQQILFAGDLSMFKQIVQSQEQGESLKIQKKQKKTKRK